MSERERGQKLTEAMEALSRANDALFDIDLRHCTKELRETISVARGDVKEAVTDVQAALEQHLKGLRAA